MALPQLTAEQRKAALDKAALVRRERAHMKEQLKKGELKLAEVFERAQTDDIAGKLKVKALLTSLPGIGTAKAESIMASIGISETRRVAGLGAVQKEKLIALLS